MNDAHFAELLESVREAAELLREQGQAPAENAPERTGEGLHSTTQGDTWKPTAEN